MSKTSISVLMTASLAWAAFVSAQSATSKASTPAPARGQTAAPREPAGAPRGDVFRKEYPALQKAVDAAMGEVPGTSVLQTSKATYLEEFGIVVVLEVALEPPRNPFSNAAQSDAKSLQEKLRLVREKMQQVLTQRTPTLQSLAADQSLVIAVHVFNANPVDAPNLPAQMIFKVKKQEPARVIAREL